MVKGIRFRADMESAPTEDWDVRSVAVLYGEKRAFSGAHTGTPLQYKIMMVRYCILTERIVCRPIFSEIFFRKE